MKKTVIFGVAAIMGVTSANAGLFDFLGLSSKKSEPTTLAEACDKSEITKFCPEIALGQKTLLNCLSENITSLSTQCANFVKKSISENVDAAKNQVADAKAQLEEAKANQAAAKADQQAAVDAQKAEAKAAAQEVKDSVKQTGNDLKETGNAFKNIFSK